MNKLVLESEVINKNFDLRTIALHFAQLDNIGKISFSKFFKTLYYLYLTVKELIFFNPDLVYFTISPTGYAFYRDLIYVFILKLFRAKIVYHLHGKGVKRRLNNKLRKNLYALIFRYTNVVLLSKLLLNDIEELLGNSSNVFFLPNGIPLYPKPEIEKKSKKRAPVILFLSNIAPSKGILVLIEATKILVRRHLEFQLIIVGGIVKYLPQEQFDKYLNHREIKEFVKYVGPKYGDEKYKTLLESDIFVFPTYYANEAFPLVLLEAMQAGLAIVSTTEGAIPEIIDDGKTGYLVQPRSVEELANKIELLITDKDRVQKFGGRAQEKFFKYYTSEVFENNLKDIFCEIIDND